MAYTILLSFLLALVALQLFLNRRERRRNSKPKTENPANELQANAQSPGAVGAWKTAFQADGRQLRGRGPEINGETGRLPNRQLGEEFALGSVQSDGANTPAVLIEGKPLAASLNDVSTGNPDGYTRREETRNHLLVDRTTVGEIGERFKTDIFSPRTQKFDAGMRKLLVGQDEAIDAFRELIQVAEAGLSLPGKPLGNFLLLGPTGSGKTKAMESLAEVLTFNELNLIRVDCGEFQHSHEIAKLIGSPPGYLGHRETKSTIDNARLTELRKVSGEYDIAVVIFDEIEKASDALWNLLLGILDKASLTLGNNERVDFSRCIIGMTSNLGAKDLVETTQLGFVKQALTARKKTEIGIGAARKKFSPEFFNRVDKVITFGTLGPAELKVIFGLEMLKVANRVNRVSPSLRLFYTESLETFIVAEGTDERYGARPLKRAIHRLIVMPLSSVMGSGQIAYKPMSVLIDYNESEGKVFFSPIR